MKKILNILLLVWLSVFSAGKAEAIKYDTDPLGTNSPNVDIPADITVITKVLSTVSAVYAQKDKLQSLLDIEKTVQNAKMVGMKMAGTALNKAIDKIAGKKVTSASRLIEKAKKVDMNSEKQVQEAFIERFLQKPSKKLKTNNDYTKIADQFKIDTTLEMYIIAREMEKEVEQMLEQIDKIDKCLNEGEDCAAAGISESENCVSDKEQETQQCLLRANLMLARLYDQMMWRNEFLAAMRVQYQAVMSIGNPVTPREYNDGKDKSSKTSALTIWPQINNASSEQKWAMAFADEEWFDGTSAEREIKTEDGFDVLDRAGGFTSSLAGKKETFAAMEILREAQDAALMAIRAHGVKSQLPSFKSVYDGYHQTERYYAKVREHLTLSEQCIHNYLGQYYQNAVQTWMGKDCGLYEDKMYCAYRENDDAAKGYYDIDCPHNPSKRCYVTDLSDASGRSGLSGYLLALYVESKKVAAAGEVDAYLTEDDEVASNKKMQRFVTMRDDDSRQAHQARRNNPLISMSSLSSASNQQQDKYALRNPNDEEVIIEEMRAAERMNWLSGSLTTKAMVNDLQGANGGKFGTVKNQYPLWNDQKEFYDQYIVGKYENMKEYVNNLPFDEMVIAVARIINEELVYPLLQNSSSGVNDIKGAEKTAIDDLESQIGEVHSNDGIAAMVAEEKAVLQNLKNEHEQQKKAIKDKIKAEGDRIAELNTILDTNNREYNKQDKIMDEAEDGTAVSEDAIRAEQEMYAVKNAVIEDEESKVDSAQSPFTKSFQNKIADNDKTWTEAYVKQEALQMDTSAMEQEIAARKANIERYKQEMNAVIKAFVKKYDETVREYREKVDAAAADSRNQQVGALIGAATNKIQDIIEEALDFDGALKIAGNMADCVRQKILQKIDEAENKLLSMQPSSELYYVENTAQIQKIHNDMIQSILDIGNVNSNDFAKSCNVNITDTIAEKILSKLFVSVFTQMCKDDYCTTPEPNDEDGPVYFVGIKGKPRDFRTPTGPLNFVSAPLREIFYFDAFDYENVEKYYEDNDEPMDNRKITTTGYSFLNCGAEMPEVWKYILRERPFVEREIDLEKLLSRGNPKLAFIRLGQFPCELDGRYFDTAYNDEVMPYVFGYNPNAAHENVIGQKCTLLKNENGNLIDTETDYAEIIAPKPTADKANDASELGQILAFVPEYVPPIEYVFGVTPIIVEPPHKLSFNQAFLSAIHSQDNYGEDDSPAAMEQYKFYLRSLFTHNQFGDYLDFIEMEKAAAENLRDAKQGIEEIHQQIKEIFNEFGDTISDDFDLSEEDDYDLAAASLDGYKLAYVRQSLEKLEQVRKLKTVESIHEGADKVRHQIELLLFDEDEMVEIDGSEDMTELENSIKQNEANMAITDAYAAAAAEAFERQLRQMQKPYCAVYTK